jgi:hypothetical protein
MNINEIEVNGEKFGIESVNNICASYTEPDGDVKPSMWYRPALFTTPYSKYGMERPAGGTNSYGNYTLDANGQLVETTDTAYNAPRTTVMFPVLKNTSYKLVTKTNIVSDTLQYPFAVYFYDNNGEFISKSEMLTELNITYAKGTTLLNVTLPENTRQLRIILPYNIMSYIYLISSEATDSQIIDICNGMAADVQTSWFAWDEDMYVKL